jgi:hypothetical protein
MTTFMRNHRIHFIIAFAFLVIFLYLGSFLITNPKIAKQESPEVINTGKNYEAVLSEEGFYPPVITINHGDTVTFKTTLKEDFWPASDLHPTHSIYPEFDPQEPIEATSSWTFQFLKVGLWKYHDHLNPYLRGTIIVK